MDKRYTADAVRESIKAAKTAGKQYGRTFTNEDLALARQAWERAADIAYNHTLTQEARATDATRRQAKTWRTATRNELMLWSD